MPGSKGLSLSFPAWDPQRRGAVTVQLSDDAVRRIAEQLRSASSPEEEDKVQYRDVAIRSAAAPHSGLLGLLTRRARVRKRLTAGQRLPVPALGHGSSPRRALA